MSAIKTAGGVSLVQSPAEAQLEKTPCAAIAEDDVDAAFTVHTRAAVQWDRGEPVEAPRPTVAP
jgi:hypothetical protein